MKAKATMDCSGKKALVTGAGTGIGRAIAAQLAVCGAELLLVGRNADSLEATADMIESAGGCARAVALDLCRTADFAKLDPVAAQVDMLVHNAAAFATYGALEGISTDEIDRVLHTSIRAGLKLSQIVLPGMKSRGTGRILFIGSIAASLGASGQVAYATAKSALAGMTRSIALEAAGHGITCNLIEPGLINTDRVQAKLPATTRDALTANTPIGRPGTPEEVAHAACFLLSDQAAFITGATLPVTGGLGLGLFPRQERRP